MTGPFQRRQAESIDVTGPALALVEVASVARGLVVADAMVKKSPVELLLARPVSSGKHLSIVSGTVAEVDEAVGVALELAGDKLVDKLFLPFAAEGLLAALRGNAPAPKLDEAVGIFETVTVAASVVAADAACKAAAVTLCELRLGDGLGGKAYFVVAGEQGDVEAALLASQHLTAADAILGQELIARPHEDLLRHLR
jgi:microcompartment protein CcmL/EutN